MAAINDLISQIQDPELRDRIQKEVNKLAKQKKFGLVFEDHMPECTPLYDMPIKRGCNVMLRDNEDNKALYTVLKVDGDTVYCVKKDNQEEAATFCLNEIVRVAEFGEPIYPFLKPMDSVCNAPDSDLWHTLIEADNYHALQLLEYLYAGKVDCIYIDPPYNTGARDWKYNNDYVDGSDSYRHSKWLSFMQKRLLLAKKLLNPANSTLIITIDEKEYLHLGCLLEELFPEANMQMVSSVINPAGVSRGGQFARTDEYIYFLTFGSCVPSPLQLNEDWRGKIKGGYKDKLRWNGLQRSGTATLRSDRPNMFYPIYINDDGTQIIRVGESIGIDVDRSTINAPEGQIAIWPIFPDGREGRWRLGRDTLIELIAKHYVHIGKVDGDRAAISYLAQGEQAKVENGDFPIIGYNPDGSIIVDESGYEARFVPGTQWWITSHDATQKGTKMLNDIVGHRFTFPKSVYAVHDAIRFFVHQKKNALIVDFFAGSGTTLHAINLLNAEDGGNRRCIMVTNNEVSNEESKTLAAKGHHPGDPEWEALGIARYVTWPRTVCSIEGHDVKGNPLKGTYLGSERAMADGFAANAAYFKLGFLDKTAVELGMHFKDICREVLAADEFYFAQRPILGRGRGCAATWKADVNGRAQAIESTFIPEFEFPGVSAALEGFDRFYFSMRTLSVAKKKEDIIARLSVLADSYNAWIDSTLVNDKKMEDANFKSEIGDVVVQKCKEALCRIRAGIQLLMDDSVAFDAFCFMNRAMILQRNIMNFSKKYGSGIECSFRDFVDPRNPDNDFGWRPFQIALF